MTAPKLIANLVSPIAEICPRVVLSAVWDVKDLVYPRKYRAQESWEVTKARIWSLKLPAIRFRHSGVKPWRLKYSTLGRKLSEIGLGEWQTQSNIIPYYSNSVLSHTGPSTMSPVGRRKCVVLKLSLTYARYPLSQLTNSLFKEMKITGNTYLVRSVRVRTLLLGQWNEVVILY